MAHDALLEQALDALRNAHALYQETFIAGHHDGDDDDLRDESATIENLMPQIALALGGIHAESYAEDKQKKVLGRIRTADGYVFYHLADDSIVDSLDPESVDMSWPTLQQFAQANGDDGTATMDWTVLWTYMTAAEDK